MESKDFQNLVFKERPKTVSGARLRWWTIVLFAYPAAELLLAGLAGVALGKLSVTSSAVLCFVPAAALLGGIALIFSKKALPTYFSLVASAIYLLVAALRDSLFTLPSLSVVVASVCVIFLGRRLSK